MTSKDYADLAETIFGLGCICSVVAAATGLLSGDKGGGPVIWTVIAVYFVILIAVLQMPVSNGG